MDEDLDYLRQVDLPESMGGGQKFVTDKIKDEEEKEKEIKDAVANSMDGGQANYLIRLAAYGQAGLEMLDWPEGWERYCLATDGREIRVYGRWFKTKVGIQIIVKDKDSNIYSRGVLTTMDPIIDIANVDTLIIQAENTIDSAKGILLSDNKDTVSSLKRTQSGIYLPN